MRSTPYSLTIFQQDTRPFLRPSIMFEAGQYGEPTARQQRMAGSVLAAIDSDEASHSHRSLNDGVQAAEQAGTRTSTGSEDSTSPVVGRHQAEKSSRQGCDHQDGSLSPFATTQLRGERRRSIVTQVSIEYATDVHASTFFSLQPSLHSENSGMDPVSSPRGYSYPNPSKCKPGC